MEARYDGVFEVVVRNVDRSVHLIKLSVKVFLGQKDSRENAKRLLEHITRVARHFIGLQGAVINAREDMFTSSTVPGWLSKGSTSPLSVPRIVDKHASSQRRPDQCVR